jgi:hypothetical protein
VLPAVFFPSSRAFVLVVGLVVLICAAVSPFLMHPSKIVSHDNEFSPEAPSERPPLTVCPDEDLAGSDPSRVTLSHPGFLRRLRDTLGYQRTTLGDIRRLFEPYKLNDSFRDPIAMGGGVSRHEFSAEAGTAIWLILLTQGTSENAPIVGFEVTFPEFSGDTDALRDKLEEKDFWDYLVAAIPSLADWRVEYQAESWPWELTVARVYGENMAVSRQWHRCRLQRWEDSLAQELGRPILDRLPREAVGTTDIRLLTDPFARIEFGDKCGFISTETEGATAIKSLVEASDWDGVRQVLRGANPVGRVFAARALLAANRRAPEDELPFRTILSTTDQIPTCGECEFGQATPHALLKNFLSAKALASNKGSN